MIATIVLSALMALAPQQRGPKSLDIDPSKVLPPVIVPTGTVIPVKLMTRISTKNAKNGDDVYGTTAFPIAVDRKIVIPAGSRVAGKITEVQRPGRVKGKGEITLSFQTLVLPSGLSLPIYTSLRGT